MAEHQPLEATLRRLKDERDEADARYNDALTAVDRALRAPVTLPQPAPPLDEHQLASLNQTWNTLPAEPPRGAGVRGRLTGFIWGIVGPYLQRQLTFNSQIVDHLNRNATAARDANRSAEATVAALRDHVAAMAEFHARLMQYLQQITAYVDTKDRDAAGGALVLNASLSGLAENVAKHAESLAAREHRYEARATALSASHDELRAMIGVAQQALVSLKREVERLNTFTERHPESALSPESSRMPDPAPRIPDPASRIPDSAASGAFTPSLDAYKYVGFEDQFRGSRDVIRARFESYLPLFDGASDLLDVGCGRGEFLDLLTARGLRARGIELNHEMAEDCRARGLDVTEADAVGYLSALPDATHGGILSAQVVEHLQPGYLLRFIELAFVKLRPGGRLVLETLNPACWVAFFESYIRDITHVWPLHPETLKYLVVASGFNKASVEFRSPVPQQDRLQPVAVPAAVDACVADLAEAFNANVEKLNSRIFTYLDYAVIGDKAR
jgi:SAM-dependent methyltransferase